MKNNTFFSRVPCAPHHTFNNTKNAFSSHKPHAITFFLNNPSYSCTCIHNINDMQAITFCKQLKEPHMHEMCFFPRNPKAFQGVLHALTQGFNHIFLFFISFPHQMLYFRFPPYVLCF